MGLALSQRRFGFEAMSASGLTLGVGGGLVDAHAFDTHGADCWGLGL